MRISYWSSDVCSSDLIFNPEQQVTGLVAEWLCSGLQSRVRRFNSDPGLQFPVRATGPSGTCRENRQARGRPDFAEDSVAMNCDLRMRPRRDRKSTRLNSSH